MTSVEYLRDVCRRLKDELRAGALGRWRLREIETVLRLMVPHLISAVAENVTRSGPTDSLERARAALLSVRTRLEWIATWRDTAPDAEIHLALMRTVEDVEDFLENVDSD